MGLENSLVTSHETSLATSLTFGIGAWKYHSLSQVTGKLAIALLTLSILEQARLAPNREATDPHSEVPDCQDYGDMNRFLEEIGSLFKQQLDVASLLSLSKALQRELKQHLGPSPQCMLPSFNYSLPTGQEQGLYLALEVGGSNLWMALVELRGRSQGTDCTRLRRSLSWPINDFVKQFQGHAFFDWLAERIEEMLMLEERNLIGNAEPLRMGVAWSFPIESVSASETGCGREEQS